jgi:hypothetical protein
MATRSTIALEMADGKVLQIYCHWDGYLEHNGKILLMSYSNPAKLEELVSRGDLSSLANAIGQCSFSLYEHVPAREFSSFDDYWDNGMSEEFDYILRKNGDWYVRQEWQDYALLKDAIDLAIAEKAK